MTKNYWGAVLVLTGMCDLKQQNAYEMGV